MPFIKPETKITRDTLTVRVDITVLRTLAQYATFLQSSQTYIVGEALRAAFAQDIAFRRWLRDNTKADDQSTDNSQAELSVGTRRRRRIRRAPVPVSDAPVSTE